MSRILYDKAATPLFRPEAHHQSFQTVLNDQKLSSDETRVILSTWAYDMYAVDSSPALRMVLRHSAPYG